MESYSNKPGMPKKSSRDMAKKYKLTPQFRIPEGVTKRKELLNNRRKIVKASNFDASRDLEKPIEEVINPKKQYKQRLLERKPKKGNQEKEPAKKLKPFLSGTVKVPLYYVPPPPLPKIKQKDKVVNANKQVPNIPKNNESNISKKYQFIPSKKEKYQTVSKVGQLKSQAGPSYKSKLSTKQGSDNQIAEKVISEEDATIIKLETQFKSEVDRIVKTCASWDKIFKTTKLPDFAQSLVLGATGQGRLLVSQKMAQFRSLLETNKKQKQGTSGEARLLSQDLHGFWDMVYLQVKDIDKRFSELEKLKANNWKEENSTENKKPSKKGCTNSAVKRQKKPAMRSLIRGLILEARKKMTKKHPGDEEAGVETRETESFTIQWATKKADVQLELPSTSGIVPAQFAKEPGASCSTNTTFKDQEAVKTQRGEPESLEGDCLEKEKNVKGLKKHKTGKALEEEKNIKELPQKKAD
ncbi:PREDICTED: disks large-associated protein 5-like isoform X2 [Papilio polytes]|uniref:disks large-associated protein 5-like isoform X2 n=1 Tax=Papilio polytes TaxID=76194 RepID=UPI00067619DD|nr:PREDICTED: disks large-associated protein 5-like isoform X2 [Papilio polytes]